MCLRSLVHTYTKTRAGRSDICLFMLRIEIDESEGEDDDIEIIEPHP